MALCKFVVSLANILFIVHFKVSSETRSVLTVVPNYTSRLLTEFEFKSKIPAQPRNSHFRIPHNTNFFGEKRENETFPF